MLAGAGCGGPAVHAASDRAAQPSPPPNDRFAGHASATSGASSSGAVTVVLRPRGEGQTRPVTIILTGPPCHGRRGCLALSGTLDGTLRLRSGGPDRGRSFAIAARGRLTPLGASSATGTVTGTGNIRVGRESLTLTVRGHRATVALSAQSGPVPSFSSP